MDTVKKRASVIVTIEWLLFLLAFVVGVIFIYHSSYLLNLKNHKSTIYDYSHYDPPRDVLNKEKIIVIAIGVGLLTYVVSNIVLTFAVCGEHIACCQVWYLLSLFGIGVHVLSLVDSIEGKNAIAIVIQSIALAYKVYAVQTIVNFANNLHMSRNSHPVAVPALEVIYNSEVSSSACAYP